MQRHRATEGTCGVALFMEVDASHRKYWRKLQPASYNQLTQPASYNQLTQPAS